MKQYRKEIVTPVLPDTPERLLENLKAGNTRFYTSFNRNIDLKELLLESCQGQDPKITILGCIDSRVPPEIIFDIHKGDIFSIRIAGNIINKDILGSIEFATAIKETKLVVVLGHTKCGAVEASMDKSVVPSHLSALHGLIRSVKIAKDSDIDENIRMNVLNSVSQIKRHMIKKDILKNDSIMIIGAIYDVCTGKCQFL